MADPKQEKMDITDPSVIVAFIAAFMGDAGFFLIIPHYFCGAIAIAMFWPRAKGWLAKLVLVVALLLPIPILMIGIFLAILLSNKFVAFLATQAAALAATVVTIEVGGEGGAIVEAGALTEASADVAVEGAELTAEGIETGAQGAQAGAQGAEAGATGAEEGARAGEEVGGEALGEEPEPMEKLEQELTGESPEEEMERAEQEQEGPESEEEEKPKESDRMRKRREAIEKAKDIKDKIDKYAPQQQASEEEDEGQDQDLAA